MSKIEFFWNGSFAGTNYSMKIDDGSEIRLGGVVSNFEEAKTEAIRILKVTITRMIQISNGVVDYKA